MKSLWGRRRADLATLAVAIVVHLGLAHAFAGRRTARPAAASVVELEFPRAPRSAPAAAAPRSDGAPAAAPARPRTEAHRAPRQKLALQSPSVTPSPAPTPAPPAPTPKPMFAVSMASTSEIAASVPAAAGGAASAGTSPPANGVPGGRAGGGASSGAASGTGGPASESDVTVMPDIDTDACGRTIVYPHDAEQAGIEGDVRLRISLTREGHVDAVRVLSGPGHGLEREAVEALRHRCRFTPAIGRGGTPVAFVIQSYTFHFELPR